MSIQQVVFKHKNEYDTHGPLPTLDSSSNRRDTNKQAFTVQPKKAHLLRQMPLKQHGEILTTFFDKFFLQARRLSKLPSDAVKTQKPLGASENPPPSLHRNYKGEEMQHI